MCANHKENMPVRDVSMLTSWYKEVGTVKLCLSVRVLKNKKLNPVHLKTQLV